MPSSKQTRDHFPDGFDPFAMAGNAREISQFRPSAVAIHDDGDMLGEQFRLKLCGQVRLRTAGRQLNESFVSIRVLVVMILLLQGSCGRRAKSTGRG